jgi:hypothetical protein
MKTGGSQENPKTGFKKEYIKKKGESKSNW